MMGVLSLSSYGVISYSSTLATSRSFFRKIDVQLLDTVYNRDEFVHFCECENQNTESAFQQINFIL